MQTASSLLAAALLLVNLAGCGSKQGAAPEQPPASPGAASPAMRESLRTGLARANYYRTLVGLPPLVHDPAHDEADGEHARYVVKNDIRAVDFLMRDGTFTILVRKFGSLREDQKNIWFSEKGANAAVWSWTAIGNKVPNDFSPMVDSAMSSPFSALTILNPQAATISSGEFCEGGKCAVTASYEIGLDLPTYEKLYETGRDVRQFNPALGRLPFTQGRLLKPIEYPPSDSKVPRLVFDAIGWPNPWLACPDYNPPLGQPLILELGRGGSDESGPVKAQSHSVQEDSQDLESCVLDTATYRSNDEHLTRSGRNLLYDLGAVVLLPRHPLEVGHRYSVSITADNQEYSWSFTLSPGAPARTVQANAE